MGPRARRCRSTLRSSKGRLKPELRSRTPWRFLSMPCDEGVTDAELAKRLDATASAGVARWLAIDALPRKGHRPTTASPTSSAACSPPRTTAPKASFSRILWMTSGAWSAVTVRPASCSCRGELPP